MQNVYTTKRLLEPGIVKYFRREDEYKEYVFFDGELLWIVDLREGIRHVTSIAWFEILQNVAPCYIVISEEDVAKAKLIGTFNGN